LFCAGCVSVVLSVWCEMDCEKFPFLPRYLPKVTKNAV
jgi:hypothetical protein